MGETTRGETTLGERESRGNDSGANGKVGETTRIQGETRVDSQSCLDLKYNKFKLKRNKNSSKSGASRRASDKAIYNIAWSHEYAGSEDVEFANLSIPALVRGENYIIHHIEPDEYKQYRANHLTQLMYLIEQYAWSNSLTFHKDVLYEIESGRASWKSSFDNIKARRLNQNYPRQYCSAYQKGTCKFKDNHKSSTGVLDEHFCSQRWFKRKVMAHHPSKDCRMGPTPTKYDKKDNA